MKTKKFGNKYFLRIDKGEEVISSIEKFCEESNVKLGSIQGIGAADRLTIGLFNTETHEYHNTELTGEYEITNLSGNITTKDGKIYLHLHVTVGNEKYKAFGGHLNECHISGTCEIIVDAIEGEMERYFDEDCGLNIFKIE